MLIITLGMILAQQLNQLQLRFSAGDGMSSIENNFKIRFQFHLPFSECKDMKLEPAMFLSSFTSAFHDHRKYLV